MEANTKATQNKRMTKAEVRSVIMKVIGNGQSMISSAEFRTAFGGITSEQADLDIMIGNKLIAMGLDMAEAANVRLPY